MKAPSTIPSTGTRLAVPRRNFTRFGVVAMAALFLAVTLFFAPASADIAQAQQAVDIDVTCDATVVPGDTYSCTYSVTNQTIAPILGPSPLLGPVVINVGLGGVPHNVSDVPSWPPAGSVTAIGGGGTTFVLEGGLATNETVEMEVEYFIDPAAHYNLGPNGLVANIAVYKGENSLVIPIFGSIIVPPLAEAAIDVNANFVPEADLSIRLDNLTDKPNTVAPGGTALYAVEVCNAGPSDVRKIGVDFTVGANLLANTVDLSPIIQYNDMYIRAGGCVEGNITAQVDPAAPIGGNIGATATVDTSGVDWGAAPAGTVNAPSASSNVTNLVGDPLPDADVEITSVALASGSPLVPGEVATFEIVAVNNGPADAAGAIVTTAFYDVNYILDGGSPPAGWHNVGSGGTWIHPGPWAADTPVIFTVNVIVPSDAHYTAIDALGPFRANIAAANPQGGNAGQDWDNINSPADYDVQALATLSIDKQLLNDGVAPGGVALFNINVCNEGPSDIFPASIDDVLSANFDGPPSISPSADNLYLEAGRCVDLVVSGKLQDSALVGDSFDNTATLVVDPAAAAGPGSTQDANVVIDTNPAVADGTVGPYLPPVDLRVSKGPRFSSAPSGGDLTWTIEVVNNGPGTAENVVLQDFANVFVSRLENFRVTDIIGAPADANGQPRTCLAGTNGVQCQLGAVEPGESVFVEVTATALRTPTACTRRLPALNNVAVSSDNPEEGRFGFLGNLGTAAYRIDCDVNLTVEKSTLNDNICLDGNGLYEVTVTNDGSTDAEDVRIRDDLPLGLSYSGGSTSCFLVGQVGGKDRVRCDVSNLAFGESTSVLIGFTMNTDPLSPPFIADGDLVGPNIAQGGAFTSFGTFAPFDSNGVDFTANFCELPPTDMNANATITPLNDPVAGGVYEFELSVRNEGPNPAEGVAVHHIFGNLPGDWQIVANPTPGANWHCDGHGMSCTRQDPMPANTTETVATFQVLLPADAGGLTGDVNLVQELSVTADNPDSNLRNNRSVLRTLIQTESTLNIRKEALEPEIVAGGSSIAFKIYVGNQGPSDAYNVLVTDDPGQLDVFSMTSSNLLMRCNPTRCWIPVLPAGEQAIIDVTVRASSDLTPGDYTNTAEITSCLNDANNTCILPEPVTAEATVTVLGWADLKLQKFVKPDGATAAGEPFLFTIFVDNLGVSTAQEVVVEDTMFSNGEFTLLRLAPLGGGTCAPPAPVQGSLSQPVTFACELPALPRFARWEIRALVVANEEVDVNNEARVYHRVGPADPDMSNNSDTASMSVGGSADMMVEKTADTSPIDPGATASWTISVTNNGPSAAANVQVFDILPAGILEDTVSVSGASCTVGTPGDPADPTVCNLGNMDNAAEIVLTISGQVDPNYVGAPGILNDVSVASDTDDPDGANNRATAGIAVNSTGTLAIFKQSQPSTVTAGEIVDYVIDVSVGVPPTAINVVVSDTLPSEVLYLSSEVVGGDGTECSFTPGSSLVTCILGVMQPGTNKQILIHGQIDPGAPEGVITNTAEVAADNADTQRWSATTDIVNETKLSAIKRSSSASPATGEIYFYTVEITNHGPSVARNVQIYDELTGSVRYLYSRGATCTNAGNDVTCDLGNLAVGQTVSFDILVQVKESVKDGHPSDNVVEVTSDTPVTGGQPVYGYSEEIIFRNVNDLKIRKFGKPDGMADAGEKLTYTILVDNFGPGVAYHVKVTDLLASNGSYRFDAPDCDPSSDEATGNQEIVCRKSQLNPGSQWRIPITVEAKEPQTINNTADVEADGTDLDTSNNHAIVEHEINAVANLEVEKTVNLDEVNAGGRLEYTIEVENLGPSNAQNVQLFDTLPPGVTVRSVSKPANCTLDMSRCVISHLDAGKDFELVVVVDVDPNLPSGTELVNSVHVVSDAFDNQMSNNLDSVKSTVQVDKQLRVVKTVSDVEVNAGDMLDYRIEVTNIGASTVSNVQIQDNLPDDVDFVSYQVSNNSGICTDSFFDPEVVCDLGDMKPLDTKTIFIRVQVDPATEAKTIRNEIVPDRPFVSSTLYADTVVRRAESVRIEYSASNVAAMEPGEIFAYNVKVINDGSSTIQNVAVNVELAPSLHYVSDTIGCGSALAGCSLGTMAPGEERSFQVLVQIDPKLEGVVELISKASVRAQTSTGAEIIQQTNVMVVVGVEWTPIFLPLITR